MDVLKNIGSMKALWDILEPKIKTYGIEYINGDVDFFDRNIQYFEKEIDKYIFYLSEGIINIINIFAPEAISFRW